MQEKLANKLSYISDHWLKISNSFHFLKKKNYLNLLMEFVPCSAYYTYDIVEQGTDLISQLLLHT